MGSQPAVANLEVNNAFLKSFEGLSVLVTGHTGFKGSWLSLWLSRLGARVTGYSLQPPTNPSNFEVSGARSLLAAHHQADIRDSRALAKALEGARPDVVFHLAAQALVRESYASPRETFDVNVIGTISLLDGIHKLQKPCVVIVITSDKCYENRGEARSFREEDPLGGFDPYSASKGAAEIVVSSYRNSFFHPGRLREHGVKLASARAGNVIGGGDWAKDRIVTDSIAALAENRPIQVRNPNAIRPWQHVLEPLSGYLQLASTLRSSDDPQYCSAWNFGPRSDEEAPVRTLVETLCREWGGGQWKDISNPRQPHEAATLRLSIDKAVSKLGWNPRWGFTETIARTARWYRAFSKNPSASMAQACISDITDYEAAACQ
jgi:CDP-glucose 4,6-dehydratase